MYHEITTKHCPNCRDKGIETFLERRKINDGSLKVCPRCSCAEREFGPQEINKPEEDLWNKPNPTLKERKIMASLLFI